MMVANLSEWNTRAVHADDTRAFFCVSGCATTYYAVSDVDEVDYLTRTTSSN